MIPITAALLVSIPFAMFLVLSTSVEFKDMDGIPLNRELNGEVSKYFHSLNSSGILRS